MTARRPQCGRKDAKERQNVSKSERSVGGGTYEELAHRDMRGGGICNLGQ